MARITRFGGAGAARGRAEEAIGETKPAPFIAFAPAELDEDDTKFEGAPIRSLLRDRRMPFMAKFGFGREEGEEREREEEEEGKEGSGRGFKTVQALISQLHLHLFKRVEFGEEGEIPSPFF